MNSDNKYRWHFRYSKDPTILTKYLTELGEDIKNIYDVELHLWIERYNTTNREGDYLRYTDNPELSLLKEIINNRGLALLNIKNEKYILVKLISQEIIINDNKITMVEI
jgi:hypothetical protein